MIKEEMMATTRVRKSLPPQTWFWSGFFVFVIAMVWLLHAVLAPFVTGLALAYLFNPIVTRLSKKMPRALATTIVLLGAALVIFSFFMAFSPLLGKQLSDFIDNVPSYYDRASAYITTNFDRLMGRLRPEDVKQVRAAASEQVGSVLTGAKTVLGRIWTGGMALVDIATFCVVTPVVAFYFLRDWPKIVKRIDNLLPRKHARTIRTIMREFNMRLGGFVRGQLLVCLSLGGMYATGLTVVGLNFGFAIGMIAGILSFIPYVGSIFGFVASVSVALIQFDDMKMPMIVIGIFFLGQFIEGNFLAPKLVGERVGLHAVWVIFALLAGSQLFGFTGLLLAVPVAALLGVVTRHAIIWYQHSPAYLGVRKK
jgi:predicted PurR-regulated permease PerM